MLRSVAAQQLRKKSSQLIRFGCLSSDYEGVGREARKPQLEFKQSNDLARRKTSISTTVFSPFFLADCFSRDLESRVSSAALAAHFEATVGGA